MGYTKLFNSLIASTIWREDDETRIVWITMLAMQNARHIVEASIPGLSDLARVSLEATQKALKKLSSPDEWSRNQAHQGRRIKEVEGGWLILNGDYYQHLMSEEERRAYQRVKQAEYRLRRKAKGHGPLPGEETFKKTGKMVHEEGVA